LEKICDGGKGGDFWGGMSEAQRHEDNVGCLKPIEERTGRAMLKLGD